LSGVLATFALKFLMGWAPTFLMLIIQQFMTLKSGAWAQLKLQNRYFMFQVVFVLVIVTVGVSLQRTLESIINRPKDIVGLLAKSLPDSANFYLNYVLLGCFTAAMELLRYPQLFYYLWNTRIAGMDAEPARQCEGSLFSMTEDQACYGMGSRFGKVALIMTLTVVFSTVMPIICLFGFIFFFLNNIIYGYLLVFAETKKPDLGGAFWIVAMRHILFALCLFVALMFGVLGSESSVSRYPAAAVTPVVLVLFLAWRRINQFSWEVLPFESLADMDHDFNKRKSITGAINWDRPCYIQSECRERRRGLEDL